MTGDRERFVLEGLAASSAFVQRVEWLRDRLMNLAAAADREREIIDLAIAIEDEEAEAMAREHAAALLLEASSISAELRVVEPLAFTGARDPAALRDFLERCWRDRMSSATF